VPRTEYAAIMIVAIAIGVAGIVLGEADDSPAPPTPRYAAVQVPGPIDWSAVNRAARSCSRLAVAVTTVRATGSSAWSHVITSCASPCFISAWVAIR